MSEQTNTPLQFRKRPVVIDAARFDGTPGGAVAVFDAFGEIPGALFCPNLANLAIGEIAIHTLEGVMEAHAGDWIIRGVKGEFYPCKPDIFEATYEAAARETSAAPPEICSCDEALALRAEVAALRKALSEAQATIDETAITIGTIMDGLGTAAERAREDVRALSQEDACAR